MSDYQRIIVNLLALAGVAIIAMAYWTAEAAKANPLSCYVEASGGASVASTGVSDGGTSIDLGSEGGLIGAGGGCDLRLGKDAIIGGLVRGDVGSNTFKADGESAKFGNSGMIALRGGIYLNDSVLAYAIIGGMIQKLDISTVGNTDFSGLVYGAGVEMVVDRLPVDLFAEINRYSPSNEVIDGAIVDPEYTIFRVGIRYRFYGALGR